MLPLDYASDSEDEDSRTSGNLSTESTPRTENNMTQATKIKSYTTRTGNNTITSSSSALALALPPPKAKKTTGPKKIVIELLPKAEKRGSENEDDDEPTMPAAKKLKLGEKGTGGASALLSMLPAPKKSTLELPAPKRVLGGGKPGVVYSTASRSTEPEKPLTPAIEAVPNAVDNEGNVAASKEDSATSLIPPSMLLKGKVKMSNMEKPRAPLAPPTPAATTTEAVDFFSLGTYHSVGCLPTQLMHHIQ